jgi:hypothetical protein
MKARKTMIALGAAWDAARFFILASILLFLFISASGWGLSIAPWLLAASSAALLLPVGELMLCLYPERYANLVGLLVLGKILNIFALFLLFVSGSLAAGIGTVLFSVGRLSVTQAVACSAVAILDLLSLVPLAAFGAASESGEKPPDTAPALPEYSEEEIKDFH